MDKNVEKDADSSRSVYRSQVKKAPAAATTASVLKLVDVNNEQSVTAKDAQSQVVKRGFWSLASTLFGKMKTPAAFAGERSTAAPPPKKQPPIEANLTLPRADVAPAQQQQQQSNLTLPPNNLTLPIKAINLTLPAVPPPVPPAKIVEPSSSGKSDSEESERKMKSKIIKKTPDDKSQFKKPGKSFRKLAVDTSMGQPTAFAIIKNKGFKVLLQQPSPDPIQKKMDMSQVPPSNFFPLITKKVKTIKKVTEATDDVVAASLNKSRTVKNQTEFDNQTKMTTTKTAIKSVIVDQSKKTTRFSAKKRKMRLRKRLSVDKFLLIISCVVIVLLVSALTFVLVFVLGTRKGYELSSSNATTLGNSTELVIHVPPIWVGNNATEMTPSLLNLKKYTLN